MIALQQEMEQTRMQLLGPGQRFDLLAQAHTTLQQAHDSLSFHTGTAIAQGQQEILQIEDKLKILQFKQQFGLLDLKNMRPEMFKGNRGENWRPWARKFKAYCNGKSEGFRKALDWAEISRPRSLATCRLVPGTRASPQTASSTTSFSPPLAERQ